MAVVTVDEDRTRNITIADMTKEEMEALLVAGLQAVYGTELPADFALDADDSFRVNGGTSLGKGKVFDRTDNWIYDVVITETD